MADDIPVQDSGAAPEQIEDPVAVAQSVVADPAKKGTPEWLAAMQLLSHGDDAEPSPSGFSDLEKEMQALRGMSEI